VTPGRIRVPAGELAYDVAGHGTALVLVHAGICDRRMWDGLWPAAAERYRVVRFDLRGFGESSVPAAQWSPHDDVIAVLDQLEIERAVLCGVSYGGSIELDVALAHPDRVRALVLVCSTARGMAAPAELRALIDEADEAGEAGDIDRAVELELRIWLDGVGRTDPVDAEVRERVRAMNRHAWERAPNGGRPVPLDPPAAERLTEVAVPTLVVAGEYDQPWLTESCRTLAREIPDACFELVHGVAHLPPLEGPAVFGELLFGFLRTLD
jgi:pimeloyl-ACP methyl ester carboxylesterase